MRQTTTLAAMVAMAFGAARADQITIKNIPYTGVRLVGVSGGQIVYQLRGREFQKPLAEVNAIDLGGQRDFNAAEKLMESGKAAQAVAAYDKAARSSTLQQWHKQLILYRRLQALDGAGLLGRAVQDWLAVVDDEGASLASLALAPSKLGQRGSAENAKAMELLEPRLDRAKGDFQGRIEGLLRRLYELEGLDDKAAMLSGGKPGTGGTGEPVAPTTMTVANGGGLSPKLRGLADQVRAGRYVEAAEAIRVRLDTYDDRELPAALLLRGKALLLAYEKGVSRKRQTLVDAGLTFMRVSACVDPSYPEVPEATFLAAKVCEHLGNRVAAANAYRLIAAEMRIRYPEWARKARAALGGGT
jgi:tetratricopeptide (TPR) repeat protein